MVLKNNSTKIIGIGEVSILPGEREECPKGYENNPTIRRYINNGTFSVIGDTSKASTDHSTEGTAVPESTDNPETGGSEKKVKKVSGAQKSE